MKYRFSAVFSIGLTIASFVLSLVLVVAGNHAYTFGGQYLVAVSHHNIGTESVGSQPQLDVTANAQISTRQNAISSEPSVSTKNIATANVYYVYLDKVCSGSPAHGVGTFRTVIERCESYSTATASA